MNLKTAITLILGLAFQLAQISTGAVIAKPCQTLGKSCKCCSGADTCHCSNNNNPDQEPAPTPPVPDGVMKIPAMKSTETNVSVGFVCGINTSFSNAVARRAGTVSGFTGIRLSVAFCSFVI